MNLMKYRKLWYLISLIIIIPGIISLAVYRLKLSVDFTGGSLIEITGLGRDKIEEVSNNVKFENSIITQTNLGYQIRTKETSEEKSKKIRDEVKKANGKIERLESVGPTISSELTRRAFISILLASLIIVFYIAYSFRKVPKPANSWEFGITAIIALIHDALVVLGVFSLLGKFLNVEIDPLFITAILTIIGFSVHDTIVIFDRIRENLIKGSDDNFESVVNTSVVEMLPRTINTSFLVWAILLILLLFGGETIRYFVLALVVGIFSGTYSSILNASPLLITWQNTRKNKRLTI